MANKSVAKKSTPVPPQEQVFHAVFDRIAEKGFAKTRVSDLAEKFGVPLVEFHAVYPSIESILLGFMDYIDQRMIETISTDSGTKRDLYFDLLMSRFDTLQEYGTGVKIWLKDAIKQPFQLISLLKRWEKTLSLMLDIAKDSPVFPVKKIGLGIIYIVALRAWLNDASPDLDKTMVAVDNALGKAGEFTTRFMTPKKA